MKEGDNIQMATLGGGGYGDPKQRDPEEVLYDVNMEYITAAEARKDYGVVIDEKTGLLDALGARELRKGSASRPISNTGQGNERKKRDTLEGSVDKNGNPLKFLRHLESDRTIKYGISHCGLKEHTSVDIQSGFVVATTLTPASEHDSNYLPYLTIASCHAKDPIETV